jgi:Protein of unknown function (DUF1350)
LSRQASEQSERTGHAALTPGIKRLSADSSRLAMAFASSMGLMSCDALQHRGQLRSHFVSVRSAYMKRPKRRRAALRAPVLTSGPENSSAGDNFNAGASAVAGDDGQSGPSTGVQSVIDQIVAFVNSSFDTFVWPVVGSCAVIQDNWERSGGHFLLRPPAGLRAKAVLHFIGGAAVGASPHIAYSSLLSRLAKRGFVIVATPYDLSLDYLKTTGHIVERWEGIETDLALEFGAIPVVGVGHSAGALFHAIAASLFDDVSPKAGLILVSFNNKPISTAIPGFERLVTPLAKQIVHAEERLPENMRALLAGLPETIDAAVEGSVLTPSKVKTSVLPLTKDARRVLEQFQPLLRELAGKRSNVDNPMVDDVAVPQTEFYPPPADIRAAISNMYCVEQTLVVKFRSDTIDESEVVMESVMARGGAIEVSLMELGGNHLTPLLQDLPNLPSPAIPETGNAGFDGGILGMLVTGVRDAVSAVQTKELYTLEALIAEWVEAGLLNETL